MDERPTFDARFAVGVDLIDEQHRQLFAIAGRVYDNLSTGGPTAAAAAVEAVRELLQYTETHFACEEQLMESAGYPELDAHRQLHRNLIAQARDMEMRAEIGESHVPIELNRFIYNWLVDHIEFNDKKAGAYIANRQANTK